MPMDILQNARKTIRAAGILSRGDMVIVGVSGGPDSVALLHVLLSLRHELGVSLHVAHFNHGWRKGALGDQRFVQRLAGQWGLPCSCAAMPERIAKAAASREARGRRTRLRFFQRLAAGGPRGRTIRARAIMLGHTRDDVAETVLMHILRGTGLQGMRGILPYREIQGVRLIRPLLGVKKQDILAYLKDNGLPYRKDPTNRQIHFFRNRIRLKLLPFLEKKYNSGIRGILANLADTVGADYDYLDGQARKIFSRLAKYSSPNSAVRFNLNAFMRQPEAIRRMLIRLAVERLQSNMNRLTLAHLREIEGMRAGSIVHLPGQIRVSTGANHLEICAAKKVSQQKT